MYLRIQEVRDLEHSDNANYCEKGICSGKEAQLSLCMRIIKDSLYF